MERFDWGTVLFYILGGVTGYLIIEAIERAF